MVVVHVVLDRQDNKMEQYLVLVDKYYEKHGTTTIVQIESVLLIYKLTQSQKAFNILLKTHDQLLTKILRRKFNDYKNHLYGEDYFEMQAMMREEFYRRVLFCKMPSEAPFSAYVNLWMKQWVNTYFKLMSNKNDKTFLNCDKYLMETTDESTTSNC